MSKNRLNIDIIKDRLKLLNENIQILDETYISSKSKLNLRCKICEYEWNSSWNSIKIRGGCPNCNKKRHDYTIKEIKDKLFNINPDIKILSEKYINSVSKLKCECRICGYQWSSTWGNLSQGAGCSICKGIGNRKADINFVKKEMQKINPNIKILSSEYNGCLGVLKCICLIDNYEWDSKWTYLSNGNGCPKCAKNIKLTLLEIKNRLKIISPNIEIMSDKYKNANSKLRCKCNLDGNIWYIKWSDLSKGVGCPICAINKVGWSKTSFIESSNGEDCKLYIIKCHGNGELFYKIGITKHDINYRYKTKSSMPYEYEVIKTFQGSAEYIWDLEKEILKKHRKDNLSYTPLIKFNGSSTECFSNILDV